MKILEDNNMEVFREKTSSLEVSCAVVLGIPMRNDQVSTLALLSYRIKCNWFLLIPAL